MGRQCPKCTFINDDAALTCALCATPLTATPPPPAAAAATASGGGEGLVCPACTFANAADAPRCRVCRTALDTTPAPAATSAAGATTGTAAVAPSASSSVPSSAVPAAPVIVPVAVSDESGGGDASPVVVTIPHSPTAPTMAMADEPAATMEYDPEAGSDDSQATIIEDSPPRPRTHPAPGAMPGVSSAAVASPPPAAAAAPMATAGEGGRDGVGPAHRMGRDLLVAQLVDIGFSTAQCDEALTHTWAAGPAPDAARVVDWLVRRTSRDGHSSRKRPPPDDGAVGVSSSSSFPSSSSSSTAAAVSSSSRASAVRLGKRPRLSHHPSEIESLLLAKELQLREEFEAKLRRQQKKMQEDMDGQKYVPGEDVAMETNEFAKFELKITRKHSKVLTPMENHMRTAESQFYRMLAGTGLASGYVLQKVWYCVNPPLVRAFDKKREEYQSKGIPSESVYAFHGTKSKAALENIVRHNFNLSKVGSTTDGGYFGAGIYFSEFTQTSLAYDRTGGRLLLCKLLPGRSCVVKYKVGQGLKPGYQSHLSNASGNERVMFDMNAILPCYIIDYQKKGAGGFGGFGGGYGGAKPGGLFGAGGFAPYFGGEAEEEYEDDYDEEYDEDYY